MISNPQICQQIQQLLIHFDKLVNLFIWKTVFVKFPKIDQNKTENNNKKIKTRLIFIAPMFLTVAA